VTRPTRRCLDDVRRKFELEELPDGSVAIASLPDLHREEVHRRFADEPGDEPVHRVVVEVLRRADLLELPSLGTTTRSPSVIASAWSWVT